MIILILQQNQPVPVVFVKLYRHKIINQGKYATSWANSVASSMDLLNCLTGKKMNIKFLKNTSEAKLPEFSIGNVGLDFFTIETELLNPGERYLFDTGLRIKIDEGYALILKDRSG